MRTFAFLTLFALLFSLPVAAADANPRCVTTSDGSVYCLYRSGACAEITHEPPFTDSGSAVGQCPDVEVGAEGVTACETAWVIRYTVAGPAGVWTTACVEVYEDASGRTCVRATVDDAATRPICFNA